MERRTLVLLILAAVIVSTAAAWLTLAGMPFGRRHGVERAPTVDQALAPFQAIRIRGATELMLVQGTTPSIRIESRGRAPTVARVDGGTLVITTGDERLTWRRLFNRAPRERPRVTVTFVDLARLEFAGSVSAHAASVKVPRLDIDIAGAGTLDFAQLEVGDLNVEGSGSVKARFAGRATRQKIDISGAGEYEAADLASETARVSVSGAGNVVVNAAKSLTVDISGAGQVSYVGDPELKKSIRGFGQVRRYGNRHEIHVDERRDDAPRPKPPPHSMLIA
ncbi:MAG TPA: head GIN domain-containing protein [Casimicrobiaceae bacterium]|nr:head GIN domain-containing protein [Casimicrobiaceae bacterium]